MNRHDLLFAELPDDGFIRQRTGATFEITLLSHKPMCTIVLRGDRAHGQPPSTRWPTCGRRDTRVRGVFIATQANARDLETAAELLVALGAYGSCTTA